MQNDVRSDMPIFGGDAQRWHNPFELYVTCPKFTVEAGTGLTDKGAQISLVRRKSLKKLPREDIVETSVTMQGKTGNCRSLNRAFTWKLMKVSLISWMSYPVGLMSF
jgi:hypothetical protein